MRAAAGWGSEPHAVAQRAVLNTHVHVPPNFSAFRTVEDAVATAATEDVLVLGISNFHDLGVYRRFAAAAQAFGILPLLGFEVIALLGPEARAGIRVNDPENPGRAYLCGKGTAGATTPTGEAARLIARARSLNEDRIRRVVALLQECLTGTGLETDLAYDSIVDGVAEEADVPREWVLLQERHIAEACQRALFRRFDPERRAAVLEAAFRGPPGSPPDDAMAVQREVRSRLIKTGGRAFVPESPLTLDDAMRLLLELDGVPCYPILADGVRPVCQWEEPPADLAARLVSLGIVAAELIPVRNRPEVVAAYVTAVRDAGIVVTAGTEHNTRERIPLEPRCVDGSPVPDGALEAFREGACVMAAHQHLRAQGRPGFVDREGRPATGFPDAEGRIRWFRDLGADLIAEHVRAVTA